MERDSYLTDLTNDEWKKVQMLVTSASGRGRQRSVEEREVLNAILYVKRTGCAWRLLPNDLPPWSTVYYYYNQWNADGTLQCICRLLGR